MTPHNQVSPPQPMLQFVRERSTSKPSGESMRWGLACGLRYSVNVGQKNCHVRYRTILICLKNTPLNSKLLPPGIAERGNTARDCWQMEFLSYHANEDSGISRCWRIPFPGAFPAAPRPGKSPRRSPKRSSPGSGCLQGCHLIGEPILYLRCDSGSVSSGEWDWGALRGWGTVG